MNNIFRIIKHPHHEVLKTALQTNHISLPHKCQADFCAACYMGKAHRLHAPSSTTVYNTPFELVIYDLWGPAPIQSSSGYQYFLTCVDACTRFTWVFPPKLKSNTHLICSVQVHGTKAILYQDEVCI